MKKYIFIFSTSLNKYNIKIGNIIINFLGKFIASTRIARNSVPNFPVYFPMSANYRSGTGNGKRVDNMVVNSPLSVGPSFYISREKLRSGKLSGFPDKREPPIKTGTFDGRFSFYSTIVGPVSCTFVIYYTSLYYFFNIFFYI